MSKPTISTRLSIAWFPDPASEPTSTLVLSTPSGRFVDIRITLDRDTGIETETDTDGMRRRGLKIRGKLEMANAGWGTFGVDGDGRKWGKWTHEIDSRPGFSDGEVDGEVDIGWMETRDNGDVVEVGRMKDPEGVLRDYEEVWRDVKFEGKDGWKVIDSADEKFGGSEEEKRIKKVLEGKKFRCVAIRVGRYAQGILKAEGVTDAVVFRAERSDAGTWEVVFSQGSESVVRALLLSVE